MFAVCRWADLSSKRQVANWRNKGGGNGIVCVEQSEAVSSRFWAIGHWDKGLGQGGLGQSGWG